MFPNCTCLLIIDVMRFTQINRTLKTRLHKKPRNFLTLCVDTKLFTPLAYTLHVAGTRESLLIPKITLGLDQYSMKT